MGSYLVMKNNIKRLFLRKSTYLVMFIFPLIFIVIGLINSMLDLAQVRVCIRGREIFACDTQKQLNENVDISVDEYSNSDIIMGKYNYVIDEEMPIEEVSEIISHINKATEDMLYKDNEETPQNTIAILLAIFMTIATLYSLNYFQDKKDRVIDRFTSAGYSNVNYISGYFFANIIVIAIQLAIIFLLLKLFDNSFDISITKLTITLVFISLVSSIYGVCMTLISKSEMMAGILGSSIAVILALLSGVFVSIENMPQIFQHISIISPIRWLTYLLV